MLDVSDLNLIEPDSVEWDKYEEGGKPLPPKDRYTFNAPSQFTKESFRRGHAGQLIANVSSKIADGPHAGFETRYQEVSAKKYSNRNASQAGDYLRSVGIKAQPSNNAEYVNAIISTAGRTYQADADWEVYHKETGYEVKGYENFPDNGKGGKLAYILLDGQNGHPEVKDEAGNPIRLPARFRVQRYVSKG